MMGRKQTYAFALRGLGSRAHAVSPFFMFALGVFSIVAESSPVDASRGERFLVVLLLTTPFPLLTTRQAETTQVPKILDVGCIELDTGLHLLCTWGARLRNR